MALKFALEGEDTGKPPLLARLAKDIIAAGDLCLLLGDDDEAVLKLDPDGTLVLFCCHGDEVQEEYPELFDKDGYLKVRRDGSAKLLK